jgi:hypothetical protein
MDFYTNGPKLMIGGDPHAHDMKKVEQLEREYASVDYVLTGAVFSKKLSPPYFYPKEETRAKHVYFPHSVPDQMPVGLPWAQRNTIALLSGSVSQDVYPFRWQCREIARRGGQIELLDLNNFQHAAYFEHLGKYKAAITCPSVFEYMVAKYVEIPWTGTVLIAPKVCKEESELMGFEHSKNVIWTDHAHSVSRAVEVALTQGENVARAGAELMQKSHTASRRLDYVVRLVERIKQGSFVPEDAKDIFLKDRKGEHTDV